MRVMLVVPTFHYKDGGRPLSVSDFPSGLAYLAATLKQAGHEVIGCNPNNITGYVSAPVMLQDTLQRKIRETKPDMIGLGGLCTDYAFLRDAIAIIRATDASIPIVLGGQIVTNDAKDVFNLLKPDFAVKGEGEDAVVKLANAIQSKGKPPYLFEEVPNLVYPQYQMAHINGKDVSVVGYIFPKETKAHNVDSLPFPDYEPFGIQDMLDNHSMDTRLLYRYSRPNPRPFNIVASRSCPFTCTFCVHGRRDIPYRARSIGNVMAEIQAMYERYQFNILIILDELFAVDKERMVDFCEAIISGKENGGWDFDWMFQTHASARFDLDTLKLAKRAGCFFFSYGLESASPVVLESMNKRIKVEQVIEAMELAKQAGVGFGANLIFGDSAETQETWAESLSFWLKYGQDNFTFLSQLMPYPGSKIFADCQAKGMFQDKRKYYEHIDEGVINMTPLPDKVFTGLLQLTAHLEREWFFVMYAPEVRWERESGTMYRIWAICPHCGAESMYRENIPKMPMMLGTGCQKCNRRMKVEIGGENG